MNGWVIRVIRYFMLDRYLTELLSSNRICGRLVCAGVRVFCVGANTHKKYKHTLDVLTCLPQLYQVSHDYLPKNSPRRQAYRHHQARYEHLCVCLCVCVYAIQRVRVRTRVSTDLRHDVHVSGPLLVACLVAPTHAIRAYLLAACLLTCL